MFGMTDKYQCAEVELQKGSVMRLQYHFNCQHILWLLKHSLCSVSKDTFIPIPQKLLIVNPTAKTITRTKTFIIQICIIYFILLYLWRLIGLGSNGFKFHFPYQETAGAVMNVVSCKRGTQFLKNVKITRKCVYL